MTAQASDQVRFLDKLWSIAATDGSGLFDPSQVGIKPAAQSTACYRGFRCTYEVAEGALILIETSIGLDPSVARLIGTERAPLVFGHAFQGKGVTDYCGHRVSGLRQSFPYEGGMLVGHGFLQELYMHLGFHPAYKFAEVHELIFAKGHLVESHDRSSAMAEFRVKFNVGPASVGGKPYPLPKDEAMAWIAARLTRAYRGVDA